MQRSWQEDDDKCTFIVLAAALTRRSPVDRGRRGRCASPQPLVTQMQR